MSRREAVEAQLKQNLRILLRGRVKARQTGPVEPRSNRLFLYYGLLLRSLPHYTEQELITVQQQII